MLNALRDSRQQGDVAHMAGVMPESGGYEEVIGSRAGFIENILDRRSPPIRLVYDQRPPEDFCSRRLSEQFFYFRDSDHSGYLMVSTSGDGTLCYEYQLETEDVDLMELELPRLFSNWGEINIRIEQALDQMHFLESQRSPLGSTCLNYKKSSSRKKRAIEVSHLNLIAPVFERSQCYSAQIPSGKWKIGSL